jgi:hypothetical protein
MICARVRSADVPHVHRVDRLYRVRARLVNLLPIVDQHGRDVLYDAERPRLPPSRDIVGRSFEFRYRRTDFARVNLLTGWLVERGQRVPKTQRHLFERRLDRLYGRRQDRRPARRVQRQPPVLIRHGQAHAKISRLERVVDKSVKPAVDVGQRNLAEFQFGRAAGGSVRERMACPTAGIRDAPAEDCVRRGVLGTRGKRRRRFVKRPRIAFWIDRRGELHREHRDVRTDHRALARLASR